MTILSAAIILAFTTIEFLDYRRVNLDTSIVVDKSRGERLTVRMNVTFPKVPCYRKSAARNGSRILTRSFLLTVLSLDVMDISGETQRDLSHNIAKARLDESGKVVPNSHSSEMRNKLDVMNDQTKDNYCGSCYGGVAPGDSGCCNSCEEVRQAYVNKGWSFSNPDSIEQVIIALYWAVSCFASSDTLIIIVRTGTLVRQAQGAINRGMQRFGSSPSKQSHRQHPSFARQVLPNQLHEHSRACSILEG